MSGEAVTYHIIGGGIAGLAAAKFIKKKNIKNKVIVYEAAAVPGGRCRSFFNHRLGRTIDNATHVVLGANKNVLHLMKKPEFSGMANFFENGRITRKFWKYPELILLSVFNTKPAEIAFALIRKSALKLFPFLPKQLKIFYSKGDLSSRLIEPLSSFVDDMKTGYKLLGFSTEGNVISSLTFTKEKIDIAPQDKIICALDAANYSRIFNGPEFEFNEIINIFYRTSTPLTLPEDKKFVATPQNIADWIFVNQDIVAATISDSADITDTNEELARKVWLEIRALNNIKAAFLPPYEVMRYKRATLKQDAFNNKLRPISAQSRYKNMALAGDWTMKNMPCCLEAAVLSAKRAVKQLCDRNIKSFF